MPNSKCQLTLLGRLALTGPSGEDIILPTRKDRLLLAYLAVNAGRPQRREELASLLWGDRGEEQARGSLRQSLAALREMFRAHGCEPIEASRDQVTFDPRQAQVDMIRFLTLARDETDPVAALGAYGGPLLDGNDSGLPAYDQWLLGERQRLEELAAGLVERAARLQLQKPQAQAAAMAARSILQRDRVHETLYRALMRLLARQGDRAAALKAYGECRAALKAELGIEPEFETEQLYRDIVVDRTDSPMVFGGQRPVIAVLPLANLSADERLTLVGSGLAEEIITGLGRFRLLDVIDRNSSMVAAHTSSDTAEIGKRLGAEWVVQGSLQRQSNGFRIIVSLVQAANRKQVWSDRFEVDEESVLAVPDTISREIVARLAGRVERSIVELSRQKPKFAAYELLLRGVAHLRGYGPGENAKAKALFIEALELDPDYPRARAYSAFADVVINDYNAAPPDVLERARQEMALAVEADPDDARCRWLLGMTLGFLGDPEGEYLQYQQALSLNPNDAFLLAGTGMVLCASGRADEGIAQMREAMRLDPYHPTWFWIDLGSAMYVTGRFADALECYRHRSAPMVWLKARIAACHAQLGQLADAQRIVAEVLKAQPDFRISTFHRIGYWRDEQKALIVDGLRKAGFPD